MVDITDLLKAVVSLFLAITELFLIPWLKEKTNQEKFKKTWEYVKIGVYAAEQIYGATKGAEKKAYVVEYLKSKGICFDEKTIDNMIESVVLEMNNELLK